MFVRLATPADVSAIVALGAAMAAETRPYLPFEEVVWREHVEASFRSLSPTFFVVDDRHDVIGFLEALAQGYSFCSGLLVSQELVFVRPDKRGSRAAAHLFQAFVAWGERLNARELYAGVATNVHPERTARFMQHFGFAHAGYTLRRLGSGDV